MRHLTAWGLLAALTACEAHINAGPPAEPAPDAAQAGTSPIDAPVVVSPAPDAFQLPPWSLAVKVAPAATAAIEDDDTLSVDTLELIFAVDPGTGTGKDLYSVARASTSDDWKAVPTKLAFDSSTASDESPRLTLDGKTLFFASGRASNNGTLDIFQVDRPVAGSATTWGTPHALSGVNTTTLTEKWYMRCHPAGATVEHFVVVQNNASGVGDLFEGDVGSAPIAIDALNSTANDTSAFITDDCLTIYFASTRTTPMRLFTSQRVAVDAPWDPPVAMHDFDSIGGNQEDPWISPDGRTFAFASDAAGKGNKDIYLSTR